MVPGTRYLVYTYQVPGIRYHVVSRTTPFHNIRTGCTLTVELKSAYISGHSSALSYMHTFHTNLSGNVRTVRVFIITPKRYLHFRTDWYREVPGVYHSSGF